MQDNTKILNLEYLQNLLDNLTEEHKEFIKNRLFFKNFFAPDFDSEEEAIDAILDDDGSNWGEGERTAYEQGQRDMLQTLIYTLER